MRVALIAAARHLPWIALLLAAGCSSDPVAPAGSGGGGSSGSGGSGGSAGTSGSAGAAGSTWACDGAGPVDLGGSWAALLDLQLLLSSQTGGTATLCPEKQTNRATIVMVLQNKQSAGSTSIEQVQPVFCTIELPALTAMVGQCDTSATNSLTVDLLLAPPLLAALPTIPVTSVAGSLSSLDPGAGFLAERFTLTGGTRKTGASMPAWQGTVAGCGASDAAPGRSAQCEEKCVDDCSALLDDDKDGRTATTFHLCGYSSDDLKSNVKCKPESPSEAGVTIQGPLMLAFQVDPLMQGKASSSCEVRGTVDAQVLYHVVGGDMYLANTQIGVQSAMKSLPLFTVDPQQSKFRMVRVDGAHGAPDWKLDPKADAVAACQIALQHRNELQ
ncbi:MAG: hypothetical protein HY898_23740 [Deltaproteobacteria bacterium]|nr:hypothetical protein [Deltaproteobacteria bacterium]